MLDLMDLIACNVSRQDFDLRCLLKRGKEKEETQEFVLTLSNCSTRIKAFINVVYVITSGLKPCNMKCRTYQTSITQGRFAKDSMIKQNDSRQVT